MIMSNDEGADRHGGQKIETFPDVYEGLIQVEDVGTPETKDAGRWRVKWYVSVALFSTLALARLDGISSGDVVA